MTPPTPPPPPRGRRPKRLPRIYLTQYATRRLAYLEAQTGLDPLTLTDAAIDLLASSLRSTQTHLQASHALETTIRKRAYRTTKITPVSDILKQVFPAGDSTND